MSELRPASRTARAWIGCAMLAASLTSLAPAASAQAGSPSAPASGSAQSLPKPRLRSQPAVAPPGESLRLMVFSLERKSIFDALDVVRPLLSVQGSVELDPTHNTISVRDNLATLSRVSTAIRAFDRENQPVQVSVSLILAETAKISPIRPSTGIAPDLLERLRQLLRFDNFSLLAQSQITSREGEAVVYDMAQGYRLSFALGAVGDGNRIRLADFRMVRALPGQPEHELLRSVVNLGLGQPLILGLTRDEAADRALMLVLRYERPASVVAGR